VLYHSDLPIITAVIHIGLKQAGLEGSGDLEAGKRIACLVAGDSRGCVGGLEPDIIGLRALLEDGGPIAKLTPDAIGMDDGSSTAGDEQILRWRW